MRSSRFRGGGPRRPDVPVQPAAAVHAGPGEMRRRRQRQTVRARLQDAGRRPGAAHSGQTHRPTGMHAYTIYYVYGSHV